MNMHDLISGIDEKNEYFDMLDEVEMTEDEKEKSVQSALKAIKKEQNGFVKTGSGKGSKKSGRRRVLLLAAAIGLILALSSVAYATDFFGLGNLIFMNSSLESAMPEDSNQFKAMKEYNDYRNNLSEQETKRLDKEWEDASYAAGANDDENSFTITYYAPDKIKELCDKYGLVTEKTEYTAEDAADAIQKSGIPQNFIGSFDLGIKGENEQSVYTDKGAAFIMQNGYEMECVPNDVFRTVSIWKWQDGDGAEGPSSDVTADGPKIINEWKYVTNSGHTVRCMITESPEEEYFGSFIVPTKKYTVTFSKNMDKEHATQKDLEAITEQFDFTKLD